MQNELLPYDPLPNPSAQIEHDSYRFTVLTPHLIRIQNGIFDDRATLAVVHRNLPLPSLKHQVKDGVFSIVTEKIILEMSDSGIRAKNLDSGQKWTLGDLPIGNLYGTIRTLDTLGPTNLNCAIMRDPDAHCEWGLVSRDGWAVLNDSENARLEGEDDWHGPPCKSMCFDIYLFMHGFEFKQALMDYSLIGGKIPMPSKFMFGVLWTRWYDFDSLDLKALVKGFTVRGLPLDVLVLDMNWHKKPWWGGYSVDERIIPDWPGLVRWIHDRGVAIGLNVHDCLLSEPQCPSGTLSSDDTAFWAEYLAVTQTSLLPNQTTVPLNLVNKTLALAKEDVVIKSFEGSADLWWIDWQQGDAGGKDNPTIWLNKMRYTNRNRWKISVRGSVLSRFGGMGSHRYGLGFSGDVQMLDWENLSYQPFFTATAANVLFSSWSHDVTGPNRDPELFVRWTQWAAFSGVLRFHERGMSSGPCAFSSFPMPSKECANVDLWANLPHRFAHAIRVATVMRTKLVPYMYTAALRTFDSGVPWIRPLYYEFPKVPEAYAHGGQYMFGDDITVAPVVGPSDSGAPTTTEWEIYVPPGQWYSPNDGALITGPLTYKRHWDLLEVPHLMRAGSVILSRFIGDASLIGLAKTEFTDLVFFIVPGAVVGTGHVAEDDGHTTAYLDASQRGKLLFTYTRVDSNTLLIRLESVGKVFTAKRIVRIEIPDVGPVEVVHSFKSVETEYDGTHVLARVSFEWEINVDGSSVELTINVGSLNLSGIRGAIAHARFAKAVLDEVVLTPGTHPCWHGMPCGYAPEDDNLITVASMGERFPRERHSTYQEEFTQITSTLVKRYRECVRREITVDNILRVDTAWAPTQGGWPEATRLRVNYAVTSIYNALDSLCLIGFEMPLVCSSTKSKDSEFATKLPTLFVDTVILVN